jgi:hypothetical protein
MLAALLGGDHLGLLRRHLDRRCQLRPGRGALARGDAGRGRDRAGRRTGGFPGQGPRPRRLRPHQDPDPRREIYAKDSIQGLANTYGEELAIGLTVQDVQDWDNILDAVTIDDVKAAAARVLDRRAAVTGWLTTPEEDAE